MCVARNLDDIRLLKIAMLKATLTENVLVNYLPNIQQHYYLNLFLKYEAPRIQQTALNEIIT